MDNKRKVQNEIDKSYVEFVRTRLKNTNFRAQEKLARIDELSDLIFKARSNYKQSNKS